MAPTQATLDSLSSAVDQQETVTFDDKESRSEEMEAELEELVSDLIDAAKDARESEVFNEWLDAQAAFHDYSRRNAHLIKMQKPDATRVAGFNTWRDEFDRTVCEGESAIWIWRPNTVTSNKCPDCGNAPAYHKGNDRLNCPRADSDPDEWEIDPSEEWERGEILCGFSPAPVFDVSQTEGEPLPELPTEATGDAGDLFEPTIAAGEALGYNVEAVPASEWDRSEDGFCRYGDPATIRAKVETQAAAVSILVHEIAHAELHSPGMAGREEAARELEAEAVAYVVSQKLGLDASNSAFYVAVWADDDPEEIQERLDRITSTASTIIDAIEAEQED